MNNNSELPLVLQTITRIQTDQDKITSKLEQVSVSLARVEEKLASHQRRWGWLATIVTAALSGLGVQFLGLGRK